MLDAFRTQVETRGDAVAAVVESIDGVALEISWRDLAGLLASAKRKLERRFAEDRSLPRHIGHASDNTLSDVVIALASLALGAIEFPFDHRLESDEIERRWRSIGGFWIDPSLREELADRSAAHALSFGEIMDRPSDPASPSLVLWTSGTTGTPRGVTLSSRNLRGNAAAKLVAVPQSTDDVRLCVLPLSHAYARTCDLGTWLLSGCTLALTLGYTGLQSLAPKVHPTLINVVPSIANRMLDDKNLLGLDRLRLLGCGGAAISKAGFERWQQRGVGVIQGYGLTETSPVICSATPVDARPGYVGRMVEGWESRIQNQQLLVRGPHVMLGYWGDPEATASRIDGEGWLATGDQVEVDAASGQVRILGRVDDVIVLDSARKIHPASVEQAVERVKGVRHAMLVARQQGELNQQTPGPVELELWFDTDEDWGAGPIIEQIQEVLSQLPGLAKCQIHPFEPPLRESHGELTHKGNLRRGRILATRFSNQNVFNNRVTSEEGVRKP